MSFWSGFRALFSCFGSNNNNNNNNSSNKGLASPLKISGPRCFTHHKTGNPNISLRAFVSTPPPYVQPERP